MNELSTVLKEKNLQPAQAKQLLEGFGDLFVDAHRLVAKSKAIKVTDEKQIMEMAEAKKYRVKLMRVRTDADKTRKKLKEGYLRGGQAVQDIFNDIKKITKPEEERLEEQEKFAELREAERLEKRHTARVERLSKYVEDVSVYSLRDMPTHTFNQLVTDNKKAYDDKIAIEKEAEDKRIFDEDVERVRLEKIEKENIELKKKAEKETRAREAQEKELRIREEEIQDKKDAIRLAEDKKKADEEALKKADEDKVREKLLAPDKEKLIDLATEIDKIELPALSTNDASDIMGEASKMLTKASHYLRESAKGL